MRGCLLWDFHILSLGIGSPQVPATLLTEPSNGAAQPKCLAGLRALKLKEGTVTVAPQLSNVLDHFLSKQAFEKVKAIIGDALIPDPDGEKCVECSL